MDIQNIILARNYYQTGENITQQMRLSQNSCTNTQEGIELAYDLQSGTYIEYTNKHTDFCKMAAKEKAKILERYIRPETVLLDVGSGELTTLSHIIKCLITLPQMVYSFDISWSRIFLGRGYAYSTLGPDSSIVSPFVATMAHIPFPDNYFNVVTSSHALEANGGQLELILKEIFRVTKQIVVLFEPSYEINSIEGKARMDKLGYIKGVESAVMALGGKLLDFFPLAHISNPLNPTACYVLTPPSISNNNTINSSKKRSIYSVPGTNYPLIEKAGFLFSEHLGLAFPILKDIPILKPESGLLASALIDCT